MFRSSKIVSPPCLFLLQSLVLHGVCTLIESFFPEMVDYSQMSTGTSNAVPAPKPRPASDTLSVSPSSSAFVSHSSSPGSNSTYSDSIRTKLKQNLNELYKTAVNNLKNMRKDKSFHDLIGSIDQLFFIFSDYMQILAKQQLRIENLNIGAGRPDLYSNSFMSSYEDNASMMNQSMDSVDQNFMIMEQKQVQAIEHTFVFQRRRFELIKQHFRSLYDDKNFLNAFMHRNQ